MADPIPSFTGPDVTYFDFSGDPSSLEAISQNTVPRTIPANPLSQLITTGALLRNAWPSIKGLFTDSAPQDAGLAAGTSGSAKLIVDALTEGQLRGGEMMSEAERAKEHRDTLRRIANREAARPSRLLQRFFTGKGGLTGLGLAAGLYSGRAEAPTAIPRRVFDAGRVSSLGKELHMTPVHFTDEDSPFSWRNAGPAALSQYTRYLDDPGDMWKGLQSFRDQRIQGVREEAGRGAMEGEAEKTRQGLSSTWDVAKRFFGDFLPARRPDPNVPDAPIWDPSKEQVPSGTPEELYKQRNDFEEMRLRQIATGIPIGQTFGEGYIPGGEAGLKAFSALPGWEQQFIREQGRSPNTLERAVGVYDITPRDQFRLPAVAPEGQYRFNMPFMPGFGPDVPSIDNIYRGEGERGNLIQASLSPTVTWNPPPPSLGGSLEAMGELGRLDPRIADKYTTATAEGPVPTALLESLIPTAPWKLEAAEEEQGEGRSRYVETFVEPRTTWTPPTPPAPAITEALESFTAARDTGEEQRNREQDERERVLEQAADNRREAAQKKRIATARNRTAEKKRVAKENRERKAEEKRISSKQAKEKKKRRATESQMESMLKQMNETRQVYLDRKVKEEDRRRRQGYGVGAMYT